MGQYDCLNDGTDPYRKERDVYIAKHHVVEADAFHAAVVCNRTLQARIAEAEAVIEASWIAWQADAQTYCLDHCEGPSDKHHPDCPCRDAIQLISKWREAVDGP